MSKHQFNSGKLKICLISVMSGSRRRTTVTTPYCASKGDKPLSPEPFALFRQLTTSHTSFTYCTIDIKRVS